MGERWESVHGPSVELRREGQSRVARLSCTAGAYLIGEDGQAIVDACVHWFGADTTVFALFADVAGVTGVNAEARIVARSFFKAQRERACIAVVNMGPILRVVADMFRVGTGVDLRAFANDADAQKWLRTKGVAP